MLQKSILLSLLFLFTLNTASADSSLESDKVKSLVNTYLEAWATRDIQQVGKHYAENVAIYDLPSDSTIKGKKSVLKFEKEAWLDSVPDMVWVKTSSVSISDNTATYEWIYTGTYTGDWWGQKIKNKTFSIKGISSTTFNNQGLITLQKDFYDIKSLEKQLGVK